MSLNPHEQPAQPQEVEPALSPDEAEAYEQAKAQARAAYKQTNFLKRYGVDILGVSLIVAAIVIMPLPGPGGVYFALPGLAILIVNNIWIKRK